MSSQVLGVVLFGGCRAVSKDLLGYNIGDDCCQEENPAAWAARVQTEHVRCLDCVSEALLNLIRGWGPDKIGKTVVLVHVRLRATRREHPCDSGCLRCLECTRRHRIAQRITCDYPRLYFAHPGGRLTPPVLG